MRHWWSDQHDTVPWTSGTVSLAATAALFAAAFLAMRTVRFTELELPHSERSQTTVVQLSPPVPQIQPPPLVRRAPPPVRPAPTSVPTTIPAPAMAPTAPVARPLDVAPTVRPEPVRDTSTTANDAAARRRLFTDLVPLREVPTFPPGGVPGGHPVAAAIAPAGVTAHSGALSPAMRDEVATRKMLSIPELAARYKPTRDETESLRRQNEPGLPEYGRAAHMPGQPSSVPLMNGGVAVAVPLVSIDFPLFSPGPSPAERKRNEAIDGDNRLRLRRLQDRLALLRDSVRTDSLKRDSLARAARPRP